MPKRDTQRWLRFEEQPPAVPTVLVDVIADDTAAAHKFASAVLEPQAPEVFEVRAQLQAMKARHKAESAEFVRQQIGR